MAFPIPSKSFVQLVNNYYGCKRVGLSGYDDSDESEKSYNCSSLEVYPLVFILFMKIFF